MINTLLYVMIIIKKLEIFLFQIFSLEISHTDIYVF
jgi:hypothetical protein